MPEQQISLFLPERPTNDIIEEKLGAALELANSTIGEERAEAFREVQELREILRTGGQR